MTDVSIEFAHLYADQQFSAEQQYSLMLAQEKKRQAVSAGESVVTLVMIDDLHASEVIIDAPRLRQAVTRNGGSVDNVIFESSLIPGSIQLIESIPKSLVWTEAFRRERKEVLFMETSAGPTPLMSVKNGRRVPSCAILSATLLLTRLGALSSIKGITCAARAVTIVEERFRFIEQCAHSIITMTRFAEYRAQIETVLFETPEESLLNAA